MGADIYLRSVNEKAKAVWKPKFENAVARRNAAKHAGNDKLATEIQKEVTEAYNGMYAEGYFRDSYNPGSLFWVLGLSWWNDVGDLLNKKGELPIRNAKKLRAMVADAPLNLEIVKAYHAEKELQDKPEKWLEYWTKDRESFLALIDKSIELNEPLYCSI